jgi:Protein of unknown function (DUF4058)
MPLRDHFRPPVADRHSWDELHGGWPMKIVESLLPVLPRGYRAAPQIHLGGAVEIDVGTFDHDDPGRPVASNGAGGTTTAVWAATEPTLRVETDLPDVDAYEVRVYDAARGRRLVAAVELVSPANKDRPDTRRAFVAKCAALVQQQVSVTVVDVVTTREANLYAELVAFLGQTDSSAGARPPGTYAAACRGLRPRKRWLLEGWHRPLVVGQPLPTLPLWLADDLSVPLDLEASYEETCRVLQIA